MYWKKGRGKESCIPKISRVSTKTSSGETGWIREKTSRTWEEAKRIRRESSSGTEKVDKPSEKKMDSIENQAYLELGEKVVVIESLSKVIKEKDTETQARVKAVLEAFKSSKDEYTKNIGLYLSYLLK